MSSHGPPSACSDVSLFLPHELLQEVLRMVLHTDKSMQSGLKCCLIANGAELDDDILDVLVSIATDRIAPLVEFTPTPAVKEHDRMRHLLLLLLVRMPQTHERYIFDSHFMRVLDWLEHHDKKAALHALWRHANPNGIPYRSDCVLLDIAGNCVMSKGHEQDVNRLRRMYATGRVSHMRSLQAIKRAFICVGRSGPDGRRRLVETVLECDDRWDDVQYVMDNADNIVLRLTMPCSEHGFSCVHEACAGYGTHEDAYGCVMVLLLQRAIGRMLWSVADSNGKKPADWLPSQKYAAFLQEVVASSAAAASAPQPPI